jgi:hypothetical protein
MFNEHPFGEPPVEIAAEPPDKGVPGATDLYTPRLRLRPNEISATKASAARDWFGLAVGSDDNEQPQPEGDLPGPGTPLPPLDEPPELPLLGASSPDSASLTPLLASFSGIEPSWSLEGPPSVLPPPASLLVPPKHWSAPSSFSIAPVHGSGRLGLGF